MCVRKATARRLRMADAGTRPQLRASLDALAADLADEWEPAALYALLAEEASLAAAEARIKERICADASGLGIAQFGRPTRAGRRLCALRVLQYDRAELPGHAQIRAQVAFGAVLATWTCHAQPDSAVLTISAAHGAAGAPARLLRMRATRQPGAERGHCAVQLRPARLERFDTELGLQLGCAALLQLLTGYCSAFVAEEWEWDALLAEALEHRHAHCEQLELQMREMQSRRREMQSQRREMQSRRRELRGARRLRPGRCPWWWLARWWQGAGGLAGGARRAARGGGGAACGLARGWRECRHQWRRGGAWRWPPNPDPNPNADHNPNPNPNPKPNPESLTLTLSP